MGFSDIFGHHKQLALLRSALGRGRLHHAYLFLGPAGVGKRTLATAVAQALHCGEIDQDSCGRCVNCSRIKGGNHPDVRVIEAAVDKKEIGIQQIRELQRELSYRSFSGKRKVAIIDPATLLNLSAQNALLKTLEEPPVDCLIFLIASNPGGLLPTLRSRCLRLSFAPLAPADVAAFLESRHGVDHPQAALLAAMSMGSIGTAVSLHVDGLVEKRRAWVSTLNSLNPGDYHAAMRAAEELSGSRDEVLKFLLWAESWYRDLLVYGATRTPETAVNLDLAPELENHARANSLDRTLSAISQTARAFAGVQRNLNRRMVLENLLFGLVKGT